MDFMSLSLDSCVCEGDWGQHALLEEYCSASTFCSRQSQAPAKSSHLCLRRPLSFLPRLSSFHLPASAPQPRLSLPSILIIGLSFDLLPQHPTYLMIAWLIIAPPPHPPTSFPAGRRIQTLPANIPKIKIHFYCLSSLEFQSHANLCCKPG